VEPPWVAVRLFDMESFTGAIHDPAAGMGRIVEAARSHGHAATRADIKGDPAPSILDWEIDRASYQVVPIMADGTSDARTFSTSRHDVKLI
jgi:hypothetical protein